MAEQTGENQHYVPKAHLRRFIGDDGRLMELNKSKNHIQHRGLEPAGAEINIYPPDVERELMQKYDNDAHTVIQARIVGQTTPKLTAHEKAKLEHWLMMFMLRVPSHRSYCGEYIANGGYDREAAVKSLLSQRSKYIRGYRASKAPIYAKLLKRFGSKRLTDQFVLSQMVDAIMSGRVEAELTPEHLFHPMLGSDYHDGHFQKVQGMAWRWIHTEHEFVIGDTPLCRTMHGQTNMAFNYGIAHPDVLITFPMTKSLCLRMDRLNETWTERCYDEEQTKQLNRTQIFSASNLAWGPSIDALRPDRNETGFD